MSALRFVVRSPKKNSAIALTTFSWLLFVLLINIEPAQAHHPTGSQVPSSLAEGFLSGLGHPVIGLDHLTFVIAIGLLAALKSKLGMMLPGVFIAATAIGTSIHLLQLNLLLPEVMVATSVLVMGIFLAKKNIANSGLTFGLAAIAGIFHGYAYGESIVGAETTVLSAYLLGFCSIQLVISALAFTIGRAGVSSLNLRFAGFTICGIGMTFSIDTLIG